MSQRELVKFLGPVDPKLLAWKKMVGPDFDVYCGEARSPLAGSINIYLGGHPDFEPPKDVPAIPGKLGKHDVLWYRTVSQEKSITQATVVVIDDYLQAHVWILAKQQEDIDELVKIATQLPTFSSSAK